MTTLKEYLDSLAPPREPEEDDDAFLARIGKIAEGHKQGWTHDIRVDNGIRLRQVATVMEKDPKPEKGTGTSEAKIRDWVKRNSARLGVNPDEYRRAVRALEHLRLVEAEAKAAARSPDYDGILRRPLREVPRSALAEMAGNGADGARPKVAKEPNPELDLEKAMIQAEEIIEALTEANDQLRLHVLRKAAGSDPKQTETRKRERTEGVSDSRKKARENQVAQAEKIIATLRNSTTPEDRLRLRALRHALGSETEEGQGQVEGTFPATPATTRDWLLRQATTVVTRLRKASDYEKLRRLSAAIGPHDLTDGAATIVNGQTVPFAIFQPPVHIGEGRWEPVPTPLAQDSGGSPCRKRNGDPYRNNLCNRIDGIPRPELYEWLMGCPDGWTDPGDDQWIRQPEKPPDTGIYETQKGFPWEPDSKVVVGPPVKVVSLCSGVGLLDLGIVQGLQSAGRPVQHLAMFELKDAACGILRRRFPGARIVPGDLKTNLDKLPRRGVDLLVAGFPCQGFSCANWSGKKGHDHPAYLWPFVIKAIKTVEPRFVALENVPEVVAFEGKAIVRDLTEAGYDLSWQEVCASGVGAPHVRARWLCVAWQRGQTWERRPGRMDPLDLDGTFRSQVRAPEFDIERWKAELPTEMWDKAKPADDAEKRVIQNRIEALGGGVVVPVGKFIGGVLATLLLGGPPLPGGRESRPAVTGTGKPEVVAAIDEGDVHEEGMA